MANLYRVTFEVVSLNTVPKFGSVNKYAYRSGRRQGHVVASTPAGIQAVLNADVTVGAGESIEILQVIRELSGEGLLT